LAGSVMLGAGGAAALSAPAGSGVLLLIVCVAGAIGTIAAGCYQAAKLVARHEAREESRQLATAGAGGAAGGCAGSCASCTLSCG